MEKIGDNVQVNQEILRRYFLPCEKSQGRISLLPEGKYQVEMPDNNDEKREIGPGIVR